MLFESIRNLLRLSRSLGHLQAHLFEETLQRPQLEPPPDLGDIRLRIRFVADVTHVVEQERKAVQAGKTFLVRLSHLQLDHHEIGLYSPVIYFPDTLKDKSQVRILKHFRTEFSYAGIHRFSGYQQAANQYFFNFYSHYI